MQNTNKLAQKKKITWTPRLILRLEGLSCFLLSFVVFHYFQGSWWLFAALFFVPDIGLLGYFFNINTGNVAYNLFHTEVGPVILAFFGLLLGLPLLTNIAIIWYSHINFDRMLGFGLKNNSRFKTTHLDKTK